ncbi:MULTISPECIES: glycosyltransferase [unclassified Streptomyces]|uniref:glycosyltransferase n=1 Tax=unclassified Streptomyces TaxID=2593676 RepID=UPI0022555832|nr:MULTISPECIES: glycosyltransferase [unclassified Streptomyces]WSP55181.1 glycosyltransferase [Streptomyces sp. NBC_01241]WSU24094.1 glycosyltransferase [Streptomyces sp. NBC_01108]MCX4786847.1 glycosyltransferase [Streptomyces sp. NBC_01221]MCX4797384.1 glycosyltransferase [Streptomyces sp. NBC_01242]WSJ38670.1 glycosyltransferase [Streptomyces sp. NBC_01321]
MKTCQVSIVVPCFNEDEVIEAFHRALISALEPTRRTFEICYVDDGSSDRTRLRIGSLATADRRVRYTSFSRNFGKEAAILAGLRMSRGDAVVLMDADLQHPPELVPRMLELRQRGYDQVVARRDRDGEGALRTFLSAAYYRAMGRCMDVEVVDGEGDFRLLSRTAVDAVLALPESNRFSKGIFSWIGFETVSFTYRNIQRAAGRSKWGGRRLFNYGIDGLISFNSRPLRLAIHGGLALALAALAYALWTIAGVVLHGVAVPGYTTLLTAIVALGGIQLATLGVIGEYVGRIYSEVKRRPHYVVRETNESPQVLPFDVPAEVRPRPSAPGDRRAPAGRTGSTALGASRFRTLRQFVDFGLIGVINTVVYLAVYATLNTWIPYLAAHVIGYTVSIVGSFLLNSYITCRTKPTWQAFVRYPLSSVVNLVLTGVLLYLGVSRLGMDKNIAAVAAGILATPFSFLLARWAIDSGTDLARQSAGPAESRAGHTAP